MKKLLSFLLAMLLLASSVSVAIGEDDSRFDFEPTLTSCIDASAKDWFSSSEKRAMLSILLVTDLCAADASVSSDDIDFSKSYVGKAETILCVFVRSKSNGDYYAITYQPITSSASRLENAPSYMVPELLEEVCTDGVRKNDIEDLMSVLEELMAL